jgi:hypothetical protein
MSRSVPRNPSLIATDLYTNSMIKNPSSTIVDAYDEDNKSKRRSGSKKKGKKSKSKERPSSKSNVQYPNGYYMGKFIVLIYIGVVPKTKRECNDNQEISFYKDRTHSMELRGSQDSYQRLDKRKVRQSTCSTDVLSKYIDKKSEDESRDPLVKIKKNNYIYQVTNDENDSRYLNSKPNVSKAIIQTDAYKIQTLKNENRKLIYMLENSEKLMYSKLKESKHRIDKIMVIINKVWKIMQKQIMDPQQRRLYFDKNSSEETTLKKLLKENEKLRRKGESKTKLLENLGNILDI